MIFKSPFLVMPFLFAATLLNAAPPVDNVVTVQEDWEIRVNTVTTAEKTCPQWATNFSLGNGYNFVNTFNFRDLPSLQFGGISLQLWDDDDPTVPMEVTDIELDKISFNGEVVRWTQVITIKGSNSDCELKLTGCTSQSWGQNINTSSVTYFDSFIPHLNSYSPVTSAANSGVCFGKNRVDWFGIVEARTYNDKGQLINRDTTPRAVVDNTVSP